ncbi:MAG TPA: ABC transporter ATP-binding protein [bacterium]|nr:ABC transporter ATP-binding protein [bacterium]HPN29789.1 ABC transporter ATP-binding protein [bacterium]
MGYLFLKDLTVDFNGNPAFKLNITGLNIEKGDYVSVIGQNGSGKSTFLKTIAGLTENYKGDIFFENIDIRKIAKNIQAKKIAYVPQFNCGLQFYDFTVFDYVMTGRFPFINRFAGYTSNDKEIVRDILSYLQLEKYADRKMITLSGGELQKTAIGAALAQQSDILLLDEVSSYLDYKHKLELDEIVIRLIKRNETIISVTHNINDETVAYGKILAFKKGNVIFYGKSTDFFSENWLEKVYDVKFYVSNIDSIDKKIFSAYKLSEVRYPNVTKKIDNL